MGLNEYNPEARTIKVVKFCEGTMESVGLLKVDQTETKLLVCGMELPESSSLAEETNPEVGGVGLPEPEEDTGAV
ncbi:hypothetical protein Dimus_027503 [Dionaea muscipula]